MVRQKDSAGVGRRVVGFALVPFVSLISPFVVLPVVADTTDASGWAALAIGQSVGGLAGIAVAYGWQMVGPVEMARNPQRAGELFFDSLVSRSAAFMAAIIPMFVLTLAAAPKGTTALTFAMAVASASIGLSSSWIAVGLGTARHAIALEVLPRAALMVSAALAIRLGGWIGWYPAAMTLSSVLAVALYGLVAVRPARPLGSVWAMLKLRLRSQLSAMATSMTGGAYSAGALLLIGMSTTVQQTVVVSSAERLYRFGLFGIVALNNGLQAWVVHPDAEIAYKRRRKALALHTALGLIGGITFAVLAPTAARLLFGSSLGTSYVVSVAYGLTFAALAPGTSLAQHFLVPDGKVRQVLGTSVIGAIVGVPAIVLLAHDLGARGAVFGIALSEVVVLLRLFWLVRRSP